MAAKPAAQAQGTSRVQEYLRKVPPFAQPICSKLRQAILKSEPGIQEGWKWGVPVYEKNGLVCSIGAFKRHVGLWFFHGSSMRDPKKLFVSESVPARNMRKIHFATAREVDVRTLTGYVKEAVSINAGGSKKQEAGLQVPKDLQQALQKNGKAQAFFDGLSYTHRKEYIRWIETAKKEETRTTRLKRTIEMLSKGTKAP